MIYLYTGVVALSIEGVFIAFLLDKRPIRLVKEEKMNYKGMSQQILKSVGGLANVVSLDHCATRLRFRLKNTTIADTTTLKSVNGIIDVVDGDEYQVVIGYKVGKVYQALCKLGVKGINEEEVYNTCPTWRLAFFALNNTATNAYMWGMVYLANYATGIAGLLVTVVGTILTAMRIFDGITDPIIGYLIDKTDGKFGKFRPYIVIGNIILAVMSLFIYFTVHVVPEEIRLVYFIGCYAIYILGYTCQTACTKAGQACMTNDPKQRPKFGLFDAIYNAIMMTGMTIFVSNYLVNKYTGGFSNIGLYHELIMFVIICSAILTILAVIGIWTKDRTEFFGLGESAVKVKFKDYWGVLKGNRPLQMLIVAASTDKIAMSVSQNATVGIMLFGIVIGNYNLMGTFSIIVLIPTVVLTYLAMKYAQKVGQKKALVTGTWLSIIMFSLLFLLLWLGDPTQIRLNNFGLMTIAFLIIYILAKGAMSVSGAFVIPMISDCADYETYKSGRFMPGMMGTLFSFIDKLVSSFSTTIVAFSVAAIGYINAMPNINDERTPALFWVTMILYIGLPMLGWIASIIAMKFYVLDKEKMEEIQEYIKQKKQSSDIMG